MTQGRAVDGPPNLQHLFPPLLAATELGSAINISRICEWTTKTLKGHFPSSDVHSIPRRLIDVSDSRLRVVETDALIFRKLHKTDGTEWAPVFAALSYVWGLSRTLILNESTKHIHYNGFEISQLPQTIQDAVSVTRKIGLEYIWVDALLVYPKLQSVFADRK